MNDNPREPRQPLREGYTRIYKLCRSPNTLKETWRENALVRELRLLVEEYPMAMHHINDNGESLLHIAVSQRSIEFCIILVSMDGGVDALKIQDIRGNLPLCYAITSKNIKVVEYIYSHHENAIGMANTEGLYPIHLCSYSNKEITQFIIEKDEFWSQRKTSRQLTPIEFSIVVPNFEVAEFLYNTDPTSYYYITRRKRNRLLCFPARRYLGLKDYFKLQESILDNMIRHHRIRRDGSIYDVSIFSLAIIRSASLGTIKMLWKFYTDALLTLHHHDETCLHVACRRGTCEFDVIDFLARLPESKALLTQRDIEGNTILHTACRFARYDAIELFSCISPWMITEQNKSGDTPLKVLLLTSLADRNSIAYVNSINTLTRQDPCGMVNLLREGI